MSGNAVEPDLENGLDQEKLRPPPPPPPGPSSERILQRPLNPFLSSAALEADVA